MSAPDRKDEQMLDLLIKEATEGLSDAERAELEALALDLPVFERHAIEATVAALTVALTTKAEPVPSTLRERIVAAATGRPRDTEVAKATVPLLRQAVAEKRSTAASNAGWWATAASLLLAVAGWWPRLVPHSAEVATRTPLEIREELLASGRAIQASWAPPATAGEDALVGDVVFDPVTQRGFLTFRGIPANDPRLAQYQLWIVDARRKQPEPIDGGVFDVAGTASSGQSTAGDVVVPFEAKLPVGQPAAFVVTLEQPGGVVISKQEHVLALAKVAVD